MSGNTDTVEMTGKQDKNSALDVWPDHSVDVLTEDN